MVKITNTMRLERILNLIAVVCAAAVTPAADPVVAADVDEADATGDTALYKACALGHIEVAKKLLAANASVDQAPNHGGTHARGPATAECTPRCW